MRRAAYLSLVLVLPGCVGTGQFLSNTFSLANENPNRPQTDSLNLRRARGQAIEVEPLATEAGNVWPDQRREVPTLQELQRDPNAASRDGFQPTDVPGRPPGLPAGEQPRPRGSSTPPGSVQPEPPGQPGQPVQPRPRTPPGPARSSPC